MKLPAMPATSKYITITTCSYEESVSTLYNWAALNINFWITVSVRCAHCLTLLSGPLIFEAP